MARAGRILPTLGLLLLLAACATTDPSGSIRAVSADVSARTGQEAARRDGPESDERARQAVREMLANGMTEDEAVRIALLNSPRVQAVMEGLGVARAEYVQAGLVENPIFSGAYRFTSGGGGTWELEIAQSLTGLLYTPLRRSVAEAELARAEAEATGRILDAMLAARRAWYDHQAALERVRAARLMAEASSAAWDMARRLRAAGNITELELLQRRAAHEEDRLLQAQEELALGQAREGLNAALGLWGPQAGWKPAGGLPPLAEDEPSLETVERRAVDASLELAAGRHELTALARSAGLENHVSLLDVEIGASLERDPGEPWGAGPSLALPVPLFDFGQARRARARARLATALREHEARAVEVRSAARAAALALESARARAEHYRSVVLPLRRSITAEGQLQNNAMNLSTLGLLELKRAELAAEREAVEALREYWLARASLEQLMSGRLPGEAAAGNMPTATAATAGGGGR